MWCLLLFVGVVIWLFGRCTLENILDCVFEGLLVLGVLMSKSLLRMIRVLLLLKYNLFLTSSSYSIQYFIISSGNNNNNDQVYIYLKKNEFKIIIHYSIS
jgi:hypothetical protein